MPLFFLDAKNADFHSRDEGAEYEGPEAALAVGVQSAVALAADEIGRGRDNAAVEVTVEREDGHAVVRSVVVIAVVSMTVA